MFKYLWAKKWNLVAIILSGLFGYGAVTLFMEKDIPQTTQQP